MHIARAAEARADKAHRPVLFDNCQPLPLRLQAIGLHPAETSFHRPNRVPSARIMPINLHRLPFGQLIGRVIVLPRPTADVDVLGIDVGRVWKLLRRISARRLAHDRLKCAQHSSDDAGRAHRNISYKRTGNLSRNRVCQRKDSRRTAACSEIDCATQGRFPLDPVARPESANAVEPATSPDVLLVTFRRSRTTVLPGMFAPAVSFAPAIKLLAGSIRYELTGSELCFAPSVLAPTSRHEGHRTVELNRNQFFMAGVFLVLLGVQFRLLDSVTLNEKATEFL